MPGYNWFKSSNIHDRQ